jgi:hypothetical protein
MANESQVNLYTRTPESHLSFDAAGYVAISALPEGSYHNVTSRYGAADDELPPRPNHIYGCFTRP